MAFKDNAIGLAVVIGTGLAIFLAFKSNKIADAITGVVAKDLNPGSQENFVNRAIVSGRKEFLGSDLTPGDAIFKFFNPTKASNLCAAGDTKFCSNLGSEPVKMPGGLAAGPFRKFEGIILN